ncbi:MAG: hypothetical protein QM689_01425 [Oscillospiraceae bacterium]
MTLFCTLIVLACCAGTLAFFCAQIFFPVKPPADEPIVLEVADASDASRIAVKALWQDLRFYDAPAYRQLVIEAKDCSPTDRAALHALAQTLDNTRLDES